MALIPVNPSPCIPGVPTFGPGFGNAWHGLEGTNGFGASGANGQAGANSTMSPQMFLYLNQLGEIIRQLSEAVRQHAQRSSQNFRTLSALVDAFEVSQSGGFAVLLETLYQGSTAVAEQMDWGDPGFFQNGRQIEVVDFYLNTGESIEAGTKIEVRPYQGVFVVANAYCTPSDTL